MASERFGCHQVLWLSGDDEKLTEVGVMNIFVLWRDQQGGEGNVGEEQIFVEFLRTTNKNI